MEALKRNLLLWNFPGKRELFIIKSIGTYWISQRTESKTFCTTFHVVLIKQSVYVVLNSIIDCFHVIFNTFQTFETHENTSKFSIPIMLTEK